LISARSSEETLLQLKIASGSSGGRGGSSSSGGSTVHSVVDLESEEPILIEDGDETTTTTAHNSNGDNINEYNNDGCRINKDRLESEPIPIADDEDNGDKDKEPPHLNASANASISVHAFSLDTTWPVPRILAQTFWFPHAHGIIYIVDATRKNDPRGIDHLLNARQFLASLVADPHFRRKDIPVVVFANKAGLDPVTCYRVDEIAEILGCEDWDLNNGSARARAGAGSDGCEGKGSRNSRGDGSVAATVAVAVGAGGADGCGDEGGRSTEGKLVGLDGSEGVKVRPWCVKSTRCDGAGDGLRESVEWLKSRMGETWRP